MPTANLPKLTFSTREVATMLGVSRPTVDRLVADGFLASVDLGPTRRTLIPAWAIEELIDRPDGDQSPRAGSSAGTGGSESSVASTSMPT